MSNQTGMEATLTAYKVARARAAAAAEVEAELLHALIYDTQEAGMSVREAAAMLEVAKSTVARHRLTMVNGSSYRPRRWLTPDNYVEAYNTAWADQPDQHLDRAAFHVEELSDGSQRVTRANRGRAHTQSADQCPVEVVGYRFAHEI